MQHARNRPGPRARGDSQLPQSAAPEGVPPTDEAIRKRAYELYQLRGESFGDPLADWLAAEHELRRGKARSANTAAGENGEIE